MNIDNVNENIINVITIVLICISLVLISPCFLSKNIERFVMSEPYRLPKVIIQTYYSKHKIPQKVYMNIKKFSSGYKHLVFDDQDCIQFLNKEYGQQVLDKFKSLKVGAHKSDLFRYCYLYKYGGVYLDIKTELIKPIDFILRGNFTFTVISKSKSSIYQGVLVSKPRNPLFKQLINNILSNKNPQYSDFIIFFYNLLTYKIRKKPQPGVNKINQNDFIYLFQEFCTSESKEIASKCYDGKDRYGRCCFIYDGSEPIIKTRYADFPW